MWLFQSKKDFRPTQQAEFAHFKNDGGVVWGMSL